MFGSALFFPRRIIEDKQWIRSALLFWDDVYFIGNAENDTIHSSLDSEAILWDADFFKNYNFRMTDDIIESTANDFVDMILSFGHYKHSYGQKDMMRQSERYCYAFRSYNDLIFLDKTLPITRIHEKVINAACHLGYARFRNIDLENDRVSCEFPMSLWEGKVGRGRLPRIEGLEIDASVADGWICAIAAKLSKESNLSLLSTSNYSQGLAYRFSVGDINRNSDLSDETASDQKKVAKLVSVSMNNLNIDTSVPFEKILNFRQNRSDQLTVLAAAYSNLVSSINCAENYVELEEMASKVYNTEIEPELIKLRAELSQNSIASSWEGIFKALTVSVPSTGATAYFTDIPNETIVGAGMLLTAVDVTIRRHIENSRLRSASQFAYLLDAKDQFGLPDY